MKKSLSIQIIIVSFIFFIFSCVQGNRKENNTMIRNDNYKVGDCFIFKRKIKDFGVVLLEQKEYPDGKQIDLFPVMLDTAKFGIDQFNFGQVYLTGFTDLTKSSGITEGFMTYFFLNEIEFEQINHFFIHVGNVSIKSEYQNTTGGTMAANEEEFRFQLNKWDKMFGSDGRLIKLSQILQ